jgi:ABC-type nitrate/sulfonate/bicarbonate transport system substrate-binding protein
MHITLQSGAKPKSRNSLGRLALCAIGLVALAAPQLAVAADRFQPAPPEPGTEIPKATIKFGMRPYADNTFYYIGIKKGWFDEVGISFDPPPYGIKANDSNVLTLMLNGQLDVISEYCPLILPTYKDSRALKCIGLVANNIAFSILANPALKLKPIKEYISEGMNFDEALKATLAPVAGKTLVVAPELSARPFQEGLSNLSGVK